MKCISQSLGLLLPSSWPWLFFFKSLKILASFVCSLLTKSWKSCLHFLLFFKKSLNPDCMRLPEFIPDPAAHGSRRVPKDPRPRTKSRLWSRPEASRPLLRREIQKFTLICEFINIGPGGRLWPPRLLCVWLRQENGAGEEKARGDTRGSQRWGASWPVLSSSPPAPSSSS